MVPAVLWRALLDGELVLNYHPFPANTGAFTVEFLITRHDGVFKNILSIVE